MKTKRAIAELTDEQVLNLYKNGHLEFNWFKIARQADVHPLTVERYFRGHNTHESKTQRIAKVTGVKI